MLFLLQPTCQPTTRYRVPLSIMNWTGGRLRRHSYRKHLSQLRIQKRHFAKARLRLGNGRGAALPSRNSPFRLPLMCEMIDREPKHGKIREGCSLGKRDAAGSEKHHASRKTRTSALNLSQYFPSNGIHRGKSTENR